MWGLTFILVDVDAVEETKQLNMAYFASLRMYPLKGVLFMEVRVSVQHVLHKVIQLLLTFSEARRHAI